MAFYDEMSSVYDSVFPENEKKIHFLSSKMNKQGTTLDIACGVGTDLRLLEKEGYRVMGLDLDADMIKEALKKSNNSMSEQYTVGSMLDLNQYYDKESFSNVLCTGNSMVHLPRKVDITEFIGEVYQVLQKGGTFIMQIINFDRILEDQVTSLPTIHNEEEGIIFERIYEHTPDKIRFVGRITTPHKRAENVVELLPLKKDELEEMLVNQGFTVEASYSNFGGTPYSSEGYATIIVASK